MLLRSVEDYDIMLSISFLLSGVRDPSYFSFSLEAIKCHFSSFFHPYDNVYWCHGKREV